MKKPTVSITRFSSQRVFLIGQQVPRLVVITQTLNTLLNVSLLDKNGLRFRLSVLIAGCVFSFTAIVMFTVAILEQATLTTVKPPNIIAHENDFKFNAQPQTGAYSCFCSGAHPQQSSK